MHTTTPTEGIDLPDLVQECPYDPPHTHVYPGDWFFGGADGCDPRADARWRSSVYEYMDRTLHAVHHTVVPICDDEALDKFTQVAAWGLKPVYLRVTYPDKTSVVLPWTYDEANDMLNPL